MTWSFLASGLLLCAAFVGLYNTGGDWVAVKTVFGLSVLASLAVALPLSAFVTLKVPGAVARRLTENLPEPEGAVVGCGGQACEEPSASPLSGSSNLRAASPFAYSVGGAKGVVVVSEGLVAQLDEDEVETVLAHELAHLKNHDTALNTVVAVYRRVLFFDPFIRLLGGGHLRRKGVLGGRALRPRDQEAPLARFRPPEDQLGAVRGERARRSRSRGCPSSGAASS